MSDGVCRWGILGTAGIARKNWKGIRLANNARVTAVASRSLESAQRFIDECSADEPQGQVAALGTYEALLERDDVDAVYIPLPTALRYEWVVKAAEAGKHVMGEKPAASNASQVEEMLAACKSHNVQYMDGVMFMHSARLPLIRSLLDQGDDQIGTIRRIASNFSFAGDDDFQQNNIRCHSELEPYGCLGDLGWYCSRMFMWILQGTMPTEVRARTLTPLQGKTSPGPVPGEFSVELLFPNNVSGAFYNSFITENSEWVNVSGSKGYMQIDDFVLPYHGPELGVTVTRNEFNVDNCEFHMEHHQQRFVAHEYDSNARGAQEVKLFENFSALVLSGKIDPSWPEWTLKTQRVLDACFESASKDGAAVEIST